MKHRMGTKALRWLLCLALALGLMAGLSLTAYAQTQNTGNGTPDSPYILDDEDNYAALVVALKDGGKTRKDTQESAENPTYFKLENDAVPSASSTYINVGSGRHVVLDLNGKTIDRKLSSAITSGYVFSIDGSLTIKDTGATGTTGTIKGGNNSNGVGGGVFVNGGAFTFSGGTISGNTASFGGGGVFIRGGGTFTMSGGTISGNTTNDTSGSGGGVWLSSGTFTMSGGVIGGENEANRAYEGGGVYVSNGTFTMSGGRIIGNKAHAGGGVFLNTQNAQFVLSGTGEISGNEAAVTSGSADANGGGVYNNGTFNMYGGTISGNKAKGNISDIFSHAYGGGVNNNGTFTMSGGTISGNSAEGNGDVYGGGVYNYGNFTMSGGVIGGENGADGNTAKDGGGVHVYSGTFTMESGTISNNKATGSLYGGGGVNLVSGSFTMSGGKITRNQATGFSGGGVKVNSGKTFTMSGGSITENSSAQEGGGVFVYQNGSFVMQGGSITGNHSEMNGGGVYIMGGVGLSLSGNPAIKDNTGSSGASNVYLREGIPNAFITVAGALTGTATDILSVRMPSLRVFTVSTDPYKASDYIDHFASDDSAYVVAAEGNELKLALAPVAQCIYNEQESPYAEKTEDFTTLEEAISRAKATNGTVVLLKDLTQGNSLVIPDGANTQLDLGGHTLTFTTENGIQVSGQNTSVYIFNGTIESDSNDIFVASDNGFIGLGDQRKLTVNGTGSVIKANAGGNIRIDLADISTKSISASVWLTVRISCA